MDNKKYLQIAALIILAVLALFVIKRQPQKITHATDFMSCQQIGGTITDGEPVTCAAPDGQIFSEKVPDAEVVLDQPQYGALVTSPLMVMGKAQNNWFFEANIPAVLKDQNGQILAQKGMQAKSDWTIPGFVPFEGSLEFSAPTTDFGVLVIQQDNPSGDPQFDAAYAIPVRFK
jgi:hypothetical protein